MSIRRVTVLQEAARAGGDLNTAAELAVALEAELVGLFVEDVDLLNFAALPFAREIGSSSALARPMDLHSMERAMRSKAGGARRALEVAAKARPVRWSFSVVRGLVVDELCAAVSEAGLVIVSTNGAPSGLARQAAVMSSEAEQSLAAPALFHLAEALAGRFDLLLLGADRAAVERWEKAALGRPPRLGASPGPRIRAVKGKEDLARMVRALRRPER